MNNITITYKPTNTDTSKAARKLAETKAIQEVNRAVTRWFYTR